MDPAQGVTAVGAAVSAWAPTLYNGHALPTLTGTAILVSGGVNTFDFLAFNGTSDILGPVSGLDSILPQTIYGVFRVNTCPPEGLTFIFDGSSDWNQALTIGLRDYGDGAGPVPSSGPVFGGNDNYASPIPMEEWYIFTIRMRGGALTDIGVNLSTPRVGDGGGGGHGGLTLGAHASAVDFGHSDIARLAFYEGAHDDSTRAGIITGLMAQYGITA